jgi:hypothetical protein
MGRGGATCGRLTTTPPVGRRDATSESLWAVHLFAEGVLPRLTPTRLTCSPPHGLSGPRSKPRGIVVAEGGRDRTGKFFTFSHLLQTIMNAHGSSVRVSTGGLAVINRVGGPTRDTMIPRTRQVGIRAVDRLTRFGRKSR